MLQVIDQLQLTFIGFGIINRNPHLYKLNIKLITLSIKHHERLSTPFTRWVGKNTHVMTRAHQN